MVAIEQVINEITRPREARAHVTFDQFNLLCRLHEAKCLRQELEVELNPGEFIPATISYLRMRNDDGAVMVAVNYKGSDHELELGDLYISGTHTIKFW